MKLAEALILRADTQKRLRQIYDRLQANVRVQEGDAPALDPTKLLAELNDAHNELEKLVKTINRTNSTTAFDDSRTIADALAERDTISSRRQLLSDLMHSLMIQQDRYARTEIRYVNALDAAALQKQVDLLAKQFRELDMRIQELNWRTDLIEA